MDSDLEHLTHEPPSLTALCIALKALGTHSACTACIYRHLWHLFPPFWPMCSLRVRDTRGHLVLWCSTQSRPLHRQIYLILGKLINVILTVVLTVIFNIAAGLIAKMIKKLKWLPQAGFLVIMGTRAAVVKAHRWEGPAVSSKPLAWPGTTQAAHRRSQQSLIPQWESISGTWHIYLDKPFKPWESTLIFISLTSDWSSTKWVWGTEEGHSGGPWGSWGSLPWLSIKLAGKRVTTTALHELCTGPSDTHYIMVFDGVYM